jgi:biopolymer transport protein ExbD
MPKRKAPEVNAGSMADIAFLLLIFFLVTSEMSKESGMFQLLPEKVEGPPPEPVNKRNVIEVLVNNNNLILFEGKLVKMEEIPTLVKEMILNSSNRNDWPVSRAVTEEELQVRINTNKKALEEADETKEASAKRKLRKSELRLKALQVFGDNFRKSEHVVNMQATQGAEYDTYILLKDHLKQAYTALRNDLAKKVLGRGWEDLTPQEREMLKMVYKENISEAPVVQ